MITLLLTVWALAPFIALVAWLVYRRLPGNRYRQIANRQELATTSTPSIKTFLIWNGTHLKIASSTDPERHMKKLESSIARRTGVPVRLRLVAAGSGDMVWDLRRVFKQSGNDRGWIEGDETSRDLMNQFFATHADQGAKQTTRLLTDFLTTHASPESLVPSPEATAAVEALRLRLAAGRERAT